MMAGGRTPPLHDEMGSDDPSSVKATCARSGSVRCFFADGGMAEAALKVFTCGAGGRGFDGGGVI